jgi:hypothetical protein
MQAEPDCVDQTAHVQQLVMHMQNMKGKAKTTCTIANGKHADAALVDSGNDSRTQLGAMDQKCAIAQHLPNTMLLFAHENIQQLTILRQYRCTGKNAVGHGRTA